MSILPRKRFYVYTLARADGRVFYVGKGTGRRLHDHEREARKGHKCPKCSTIRRVWRNGGQIQKAIIFETDDEQQAYQHEMDTIAAIGAENLCNITPGGEGGVSLSADQMRRQVELGRQYQEQQALTRHIRSLARQNGVPYWTQYARYMQEQTSRSGDTTFDTMASNE